MDKNTKTKTYGPDYSKIIQKNSPSTKIKRDEEDANDDDDDDDDDDDGDGGEGAEVEDEDEEEQFQDATGGDHFPNKNEMSLELALEEGKLAINYFFNNKFEEANNLMKPWTNISLYHSVGNCVFLFLKAMLTFEQQNIMETSLALKRCLNVCARFRKKTTITDTIIGKTFKKSSNYEQYTELEAHAELCSAEVLLLQAIITFLEDETLTSLIKGALKIRTCFNSYKECKMILEQRDWETDASRQHFESGVRMGLGAFNLMISLLPGRVIKLLEFIGFNGNKKNGLDDLMAGYGMTGIRQILCAMTLLGYHLIVCFVLSHEEGDLRLCEEILTKQLMVYSEGAWFLFFKGRLEFMRANLDDAIFWYKRSWKSQNVWPQFHHLCFWELLWVNCIKLDWHSAIEFASYLVEHSKWSRTIYTYQKACILLMIERNSASLVVEGASASASTATATINHDIQLLMKDTARYKQRIAGKSLPMEKFICKKSDRYFAQNNNLCLPVIELMYLWNLFKLIGKNQRQFGDGILNLLETELIELNGNPKGNSNNKYDVDNRALILLLKGACLRQLKSPFGALRCFETVLSLHKQLREDFYLIPYTIMEIGLLYFDQGKIDNAIASLEDAKNNYTGYSLESRLHFRIHTALSELKLIKNNVQTSKSVKSSTGGSAAAAAASASSSSSSSGERWKSVEN